MPIRIRRILFFLAVAELAACRPRARPAAPAVVARPHPTAAVPSSDAWVASATRVAIGDGKELVLGGGTANAAIWDGRTLTAIAPMPAPRDGATATWLADGRVLVVGGIATGQVDDLEMEAVLATALLWSVDTGFTPAASMASRRAGHTATMLLDGRVLVIGGEEYDDGLSPVATAELYDPERDVWSPAGTLAIARLDHDAELLPDGRVVVLGGVDGGIGTTDEIELWDPLTGEFSSGGQLTVSRVGATVQVLSERELVVRGGMHVDPPGEGPPERTELTDADMEIVWIAPRGASLP